MNDHDTLIKQLESLLGAHAHSQFDASTADANERLARLLRSKADEVELKQIRSTCTAKEISELPIEPRARDILLENGISTIDDLRRHADGKQLRRLTGIGQKTFANLQQVAYLRCGIVIDGFSIYRTGPHDI